MYAFHIKIQIYTYVNIQSELSKGKRPHYKLRYKFKDVLERNLKLLEIDVNDWEVIAVDHLQWRGKSGEDVEHLKRVL